MRFTIDKNVYNGALDKVKRAVSKSDDDDTLKFIYHEASSKGLRLLATDGNIQVEYNVPVGEYLTITEDGKSCPHGQKLSDLIKGFPNVFVNVYNEIPQEGEDITSMEKFHLCAMKTEKRKVSHWVPCGNKARFPLNDFRLSENKTSYKLDVETFSTCLKKTQAATSKNLERPFLSHVCIDIGATEVAACGSDGQRIYYYVHSGQNTSENVGRVIFYNPNIKEFLPLLDDDDVEIIDDKKVLTLKQSRFKFSCRQMDAVEYPDWRSKTNFDGTIRATVNREELANAIKNILNITDFACTIEFRKEDQRIDILVQPISGQAISGGSDEQVPAIIDEDISLSLNPRYLLDAINASKSETVTFNMKDDASPFKLILGDGFECIIASMSLNK